MFQNFLFLGGLPQVEPAKISRLSQHLKQKIWPDLTIAQFEMPLNADQSLTLGCAFLEMTSQADRAIAIEKADGFRPDKKTQIFALSFEEFESAMALDPQEAPTLQDSTLPECPLPGDWVLNVPSKFIGEYSILHVDRTGPLFQQFSLLSAECTAKKGNFCDSTIAWSPLGTWLVSFHSQGVALSLIKDGEVCKIMRLAHSKVSEVLFNQDESFVLTRTTPQSPALLWEVQTGDFLEKIEGTEFAWQGNRLAFLNDKGELKVVLVSRTVQALYSAPNVQGFKWANSRPLIAYWAEPEQETSPSRLCVWNGARGELMKSKTLFLVKRCSFHWHPQDDYLGIGVERWNKSKKTFVPSLEIFYLKQKDCPVENYDFSTGNVILDFDWDHSNKFAIVLQADCKSRLMFFSVGKQISQSGAFERKGIERVSWSPRGRFLVAWSSSLAELWDGQEEALVGHCEHSAISHVEWNPNGIYFATVSSCLAFNSAEHGFVIWDLSASAVERKSIDKLVCMMWRPVPPSQLDQEAIKNICRALKDTHWSAFEREDAEWALKHATSSSEQREALRKAWRAWRSACRARALELEGERVRLGGVPSKEMVEVQEFVEEVVEEQVIFL